MQGNKCGGGREWKIHKEGDGYLVGFIYHPWKKNCEEKLWIK